MCRLTLILVSVICAFLVGDVAARKRDRIVGGDLAKEGQFKHQVSLQVYSFSMCGGGIIGDRFVLTAAHCVIDHDGQFYRYKYRVAVGTADLNVNKGTVVDVEKIYVLKGYNPIKVINDIAVLKLKESLNLASNKNLAKLDLPTGTNTYSGDVATISGFGYNNMGVATDPTTGEQVETGGRTSNKLRYARVNILSNSECSQINHFNVASSQICGQVVQRGSTPEGICSGDSGGTLIYGTTAIGVVSVSPIGCAEKERAATYTRVSSFVEFVQNAMAGTVTPEMRVHTV